MALGVSSLRRDLALALAWYHYQAGAAPLFQVGTRPQESCLGPFFLLRAGSGMIGEHPNPRGTLEWRGADADSFRTFSLVFHSLLLNFASIILRNDHVQAFLMRAAGGAALPGSRQLMSYLPAKGMRLGATDV
jgi:hypothetical protein